MSASLHIMFLNSDHLGKPGILEQILLVFKNSGFEVDQLTSSGEHGGQKERSQEHEKTMTLAYDVKGLSFRAFNSDWQLEVHQQIDWGASKLGGEKRAWFRTVTDNTPYFWRAKYDPTRYSRFFLDIGKDLYKIVSPSFGWIDFDYGLRTTYEDIESLELPTLYWANFFGPEYVSKIGREKIISAPAWVIEKLSNGGLLYVLSSCPGLADDHVPPDDVKSHFGAMQVR